MWGALRPVAFDDLRVSGVVPKTRHHTIARRGNPRVDRLDRLCSSRLV
jgi:hypothetical protein